MKTWNMEIINMKQIIKNIKLIKTDNINFLWFTLSNNKKYSIIWEVDFKNIWWIPKFINEKHTVHCGWLFFQIGFGSSSENKIKENKI